MPSPHQAAECASCHQDAAIDYAGCCLSCVRYHGTKNLNSPYALTVPLAPLLPLAQRRIEAERSGVPNGGVYNFTHGSDQAHMTAVGMSRRQWSRYKQKGLLTARRAEVLCKHLRTTPGEVYGYAAWSEYDAPIPERFPDAAS